ncbi:MAG: hypothetical protein NQ127_00330 [Candidatus Cardinium sp.]|nr:hypothetical protein [Candidatus Cardinium sp.]
MLHPLPLRTTTLIKQTIAYMIELRLEFDEVNMIIKALSERPFREVYELIGKIHLQSSNQLKKKELDK